MVPDPWQAKLLRRRPHRALITTSRQAGKALAVDTPVPTPSGWTTMHTLQVGDALFDEQGGVCRVVAAHPAQMRDCWRVTFSDGTYLDASGDHLWRVLDLRSRRAMRRRHRDRPVADWATWLYKPASGPAGAFSASTVTTTEMADIGLRDGRERQFAVPTTQPLVLPTQQLPIDPWGLGYWLGNGTQSVGTSVTTNADDAEEVAHRYRSAGYTATITQYPSAADRHSRVVKLPGLRVLLRAAGILGSRHVPAPYLRASEPQRRALLAGLMDADGYADPGRRSEVEYSTTDEQLAGVFMDLAWSLGLRPRVTKGRARLNGRDIGPLWRMGFVPHFNPFTLSRRAQRWTDDRTKGARPFGRMIRGIESITRLPDQPTRCIEVDSPSRLFLAGHGMIPTHNSSTAGAMSTHRAANKPRTEIVVVSPTQRQSALLVLKVKRFAEAMGIVLTKNNTLSLEFDNGSTIYALPGAPDSVRGYSPELLIIDEAAYTTEALYTACLPMLAATGGDLIAISTPNGQQGWYWAEWSGQGADNWMRVEVPYSEIARITPEFIHSQRASMSRERFATEYECAFISSVYGLFNPADLAAALQTTPVGADTRLPDAREIIARNRQRFAEQVAS